MCFPQLVPGHITALYVFAVINLAVLLNLTLVNANVIILNEHNETMDNSIHDLKAHFGPDIPDDGVWGHLALAFPNNACRSVEPPPVAPVNDSGGIGNKWIALIRRGGCNFDLKVLNAQLAGYIGAIVFNVKSNELIPMSGGPNASEVGIPAVFIGEKDARILRDHCDHSPRYNIVIENEVSPVDYDFAVVIFVVFGTIIGVSFITLIVIGVVKWVRDIRRRRRSRLSKQHLKKIPIHKFKKGDPYDVCAICLDDYEEGEKLRVLPCNHAYHQACIDPWLTKNKKTCPICKQKVIPGRNHDSDSETDSDVSDENETESENTPLLRGARDNNNGGGGGRTRGNTFDNSGIPEVFRPPRQSSEDERSDTSVEPMASVYQSSVEVHSEPDYRSRPRPPKRRGGLNTRYTLMNEDGTDAVVERPRTTPPIRPRPHRAWEFGISPASSPAHNEPLVGAVGGAYGSDEQVAVDVDDVAPPRRIGYANPALVDSLDDHIESHMDVGETANQDTSSTHRRPRPHHVDGRIANREPRGSSGVHGTRPRKQPRDGLLLEHKKSDTNTKYGPTPGGKNTATKGTKSKKNRANKALSKTLKDEEGVTPIDIETGKSPPDCTNESAAIGNSPPRDMPFPESHDTQGAVGGMDENEAAGQDEGVFPSNNTDEVEVIRPLSRQHKKKSKKRRRNNEDT